MPPLLPQHRACLLPVLLLSLFASQVRAEIALVDGQRIACPIVISDQPGPEEIRLSASLAGYLEKITGSKFEVQRLADLKSKRAIQLQIDPKSDLGMEGFAWDCGENSLIIQAGSPRGLAYGVYAFLEQQCGCRWWSHDEEDIPQTPTLTIKSMQVRQQPAFAMHDLFSREAQSRNNDFHFKSGADSQLQFTGGHSIYPLLKEYGREHPEIYPKNKDGQRTPNDLHMCYLAPGISEALTAALEAEVQARNGNVKDYVYFAGMGDWYGGQCECKECLAAYEEEKWTNPDGTVIPGYTGTLLRMINQTAEQMEKKHPGIQVGTFAYMSLEAPPGKTRPRENVVIRIPRLRHCTVHAADECTGNRPYYHNVVRWQELAPGRVHIWEYGVNFTNFLLPYPTTRSIGQNLKLYHKLGLAGVMVQENYVSTGGDAAVLKNYVWRNLLWHPERTVRELTEEFCQGYYGPAAKDVLVYLDTLENSVRTPELRHADEFAAPLNVYLTPELIAELRGILQRALKTTAGNKNPSYDRRVRELLVSIEAAELWKPGPLAEQGGSLVRTDLGGNTFQRALDLIAHCRNASPVESGDGRAARQSFLRMHGGPVVLLKGQAVSLKCRPVQGGAMGPISYQDRPIIAETTIQPAGGAALYQLQGKPTDKEFSMTGECGIANWESATKHIAALQVKLDEQDKLTMAGTVICLRGGATDVHSNVTTRYPLKELAAAKLEWRDAQGKWAPIELSAEKLTGTCEGLTALRIELPAEQVEVLDTYSRMDKKLDAPVKDVASEQAPTGHFGTIEYDAAQAQLVTTVRISTKNLTTDQPTPYLERVLGISGKK